MNELLMRRRMMMGGKPMMQVVWNQQTNVPQRVEVITSRAGVFMFQERGLSIFASHIYYFNSHLNGYTRDASVYVGGIGSYFGEFLSLKYKDMWKIVKVAGNKDNNGYGALYLNDTNENVTMQPVMIDLTLMFCAGNEPTTCAQFENWLQENGINPESYIPYDAGTPRMMTKPSWIINNNERL